MKCNRGSEISLCTNIICGLSVETSRKALQINCKDVYNHDVYLLSKEQAENEGVNVILKIWQSFMLYHQLEELLSSNSCKLQKWKEKPHSHFSVKANWSSLLFILITLEEVQ